MQIPDDPSSSMRQIQFAHSRDFQDILSQLQISLLVSTYQAGKLVVLGTDAGQLTIAVHNFDRAMGVAVHPRTIAVGGTTQVFFLDRAAAPSAQLGLAPQHDACFLTRTAQFTDDIQVHEMEWCAGELWLVNTRFSCLCTLGDDYSFVPRWHPPFVSELAPDDRCHLNGMCVEDGRPAYATALGETNEAGGWRADKSNGGCLLHIPTGQTVVRGFAMPHSPRVYENRLWLLDSGRGRLVVVDPRSGTSEPITQQPGYGRGLDFAGRFAFLGLSRVRERSLFEGLPITEQSEPLKCAIAVVDLTSGRRVAHFEFTSGIEEIFDVRVLPGVVNPCLLGPYAHAEGARSVWLVPSISEADPRRSQHARLDHERAGSSANSAHPSPIPAAAVSHFDEGNRWAAQDRFAEAAECFRRAIDLYPLFAEAYCNLGLACQFGGPVQQSIDHLTTSLSLAPDAADTHLNLAMSLFLAGHLERAWHEYEWRWRSRRGGGRPAAATRLAPAWDGSSLAGRKILVYGEQGIGDEIMFASCLPELSAESACCVVACDPRLLALFRRSFPEALLMPRPELEQGRYGPELPAVDVQTALGSLPRFLRGSHRCFPRHASYLKASADRVRQWRAHLAQTGPGFKIGIAWKGGATPDEQRRRSSDLQQWLPVLRLPDVQFINLQHGDSTAELRQVEHQSGVAIHTLPGVDPLTGFDDFAALVAALDLVVSVDNSTVHLAGALGVPTLALLSFPSQAYWRWFGDGPESPWYASLELVRRRAPDDWSTVFDHVRQRVLRGL